MKMASEYDCGNEEDTPPNSVNLMIIYRKYIELESVSPFTILLSSSVQ